MKTRRNAIFFFVVALLSLTGCQTVRKPLSPVAFGAATEVEPGILRRNGRYASASTTNRIWLYTPKTAGSGKLLVVLVAPAGSPLIHGMSLAQGDVPEHLPYVRAGYAVVAYELSGAVPEGDNRDGAILKGAKAFREADFGIKNARDALAFALKGDPSLDEKRVFVAGHSSAATVALQVAANMPDVKGCIAYAPVTDTVGHVRQGLPFLQRGIPDIEKAMTDLSPLTQTGQLSCPLFLFYADDDSVVSTSNIVTYAGRVQLTNRNVTVEHVSTGDHYDSMIQAGIPKAIEWMKKQ